MAEWGPADWRAVGTAIGALALIVFAVLMHYVDSWGDLWRTLREPMPPSDPANRVPYRRPDHE